MLKYGHRLPACTRLRVGRCALQVPGRARPGRLGEAEQGGGQGRPEGHACEQWGKLAVVVAARCGAAGLRARRRAGRQRGGLAMGAQPGRRGARGPGRAGYRRHLRVAACRQRRLLPLRLHPLQLHIRGSPLRRRYTPRVAALRGNAP